MDEPTEAKSTEVSRKDFEDLLLDPSFAKLKGWTETPNFITLAGLERKELFHSRMLEWLLDPNGNHGLQTLFLEAFLRLVVANDSVKDADPLDVLLMNTSSFWTAREQNRVDIRAVSDDEHFVLFIENKVDTIDHDEQLKRYRSTAEQQYPDYTKVLVYLTPFGDEPSDANSSDGWICVSYEDVSKAIESALEDAQRKGGLSKESEVIIGSYLDVIRREIMGNDSELDALCKEVYLKHHAVLDLLLEHKIDEFSAIREICERWLEENPSLTKVAASKRLRCYFESDRLHKDICPAVENNDNGYCGYEIAFDQPQDVFCIQLVFYNEKDSRLSEKETAVKEKVASSSGATEQTWWGKSYPSFTFTAPVRVSDFDPYSNTFEESVIAYLDQSLAALQTWEKEVAGTLA